MRAAQVVPVLAGAIVAVLAWRLAADVAAERALPAGRARTLAVGTGLTAAVYLPLVLHSALPDSTMLFGALALGACLLDDAGAPGPAWRPADGSSPDRDRAAAGGRGADPQRGGLARAGLGLAGLATSRRDEARSVAG